MADLTITAASVSFSDNARQQQGVAGAAITIGQVVYLDSADGKWKLAEADGTTLDGVEDNQIGIAATQSAADGQDIIVVLEDNDFTPGSAVEIGTAYVLSAAAGAVAPEADLVSGNRSILLFWPTTASKVAFRPVIGGSHA